MEVNELAPRPHPIVASTAAVDRHRTRSEELRCAITPVWMLLGSAWSRLSLHTVAATNSRGTLLLLLLLVAMFIPIVRTQLYILHICFGVDWYVRSRMKCMSFNNLNGKVGPNRTFFAISNSAKYFFALCLSFPSHSNGIPSNDILFPHTAHSCTTH